MPDKVQFEPQTTARVLVFHVDDGKFCIHLDWIEAIYPRKEVFLHSLKAADNTQQTFLIHRGQPAWVVDLRQALGLGGVLDPIPRPAFAVVRSGSALIALQVDECVGVRDLDLAERLPVPAAVLRDGGNPVGHLVELDGQVHVLLDPNRLLSAELRDALDPLLPEALAFRDRQQKLERLLREVKLRPNPGNLKTYARLAKRNGQTRAAKAAQLIAKSLEQGDGTDGTIRGDLGAGTLLKDILRLAAAEESGWLEISGAQAGGRLIFKNGRLVDATFGGERGKPAVKEILALRDGQYEFRKGPTDQVVPRMQEATAWILLEVIQQLTEERRAKHLREAPNL